jgi:hypothetical protein
MSAGPLPTDRRAVAASLCQLLAESAEDQSVSLEQLGKAARQIAEFLLDDERRCASGLSPKLFVIDGGRR